MSSNDNLSVLSAMRVLNKINWVDRAALDQIGKNLDEAIAKEAARKRTIMDVFRSKSFLNGFRGGLASPLIFLDSFITRNPRTKPQRVRKAESDPDVLLWSVIGEYCAQNPEIVVKADLDEAEQQKLRGFMMVQPQASGEEYALKAG